MKEKRMGRWLARVLVCAMILTSVPMYQKSNQAETSQVINKTTDNTSYKKTVEKPSKVTGLKLKNVRGRKIKVSWKGKKNISGGYQIQYAQNIQKTKRIKTAVEPEIIRPLAA